MVMNARRGGQDKPPRRQVANTLGITEHRARRLVDEAAAALDAQAGQPAAQTSPTTAHPLIDGLSTVAARAISGLARRIEGGPPPPLQDPSPAPETEAGDEVGGVGGKVGDDTPPTPTHPIVKQPPTVEPTPLAPLAPLVSDPPPTPAPAAHPAGDTPPTRATGGRLPGRWPIALIGIAAAVAIWGGWVELGTLTGFGLVHPLPGLPGWAGDLQINTAIVLPIGIEAYGLYALRVWLSSAVLTTRTRSYACWSAWASLGVGAGAQIASHLMRADGMTTAPWQVTVAVACVPVAVLGLATGLATLVRRDTHPGEQAGEGGR